MGIAPMTKESLAFWAIILGCILAAGIIWLRFKQMTNGRPKGIGATFIQLVTVVLVIPFIFALALEGIIDKQVVSVLLGALIGGIISLRDSGATRRQLLTSSRSRRKPVGRNASPP